MTARQLEVMIWDIIGVTGWTLPVIVAMTMPQLAFVQRGRGRILYPRLEPQLSFNYRELSDEPIKKGQPSAVARILQAYDEKKNNVKRKLTVQEQRTARARRILLEPYLGDPDAVEEEASARGLPEPFPGMGADEAQAWVAWVKGGHCPAPIWLEIQDVYDNIYAAAKATA